MVMSHDLCWHKGELSGVARAISISVQQFGSMRCMVMMVAMRSMGRASRNSLGMPPPFQAIYEISLLLTQQLASSTYNV